MSAWRQLDLRSIGVTHGRSHSLSVVAPGKICRAVTEPLGDAAGDGEQYPSLLARRVAIDNGGRSHDHDRRLHLVAVVKDRCAQGADAWDGPVPDRGKAGTADSLELGSQLSERRPALTARSRQFRLELRQDQSFRHECREQLSRRRGGQAKDGSRLIRESRQGRAAERRAPGGSGR